MNANEQIDILEKIPCMKIIGRHLFWEELFYNGLTCLTCLLMLFFTNEGVLGHFIGWIGFSLVLILVLENWVCGLHTSFFTVLDVDFQPSGTYAFIEYWHKTKRSEPFSSKDIKKLILYGESSNPYKILIRYKSFMHRPIRIYRNYWPETSYHHFADHLTSVYPSLICHRKSLVHRATIVAELWRQLVVITGGILLGCVLAVI